MPFGELLREYPGIPRAAPRMAFSLRERFFQNWGGSQVSDSCSRSKGGGWATVVVVSVVLPERHRRFLQRTCSD